jgi:hypothetical protein
VHRIYSRLLVARGLLLRVLSWVVIGGALFSGFFTVAAQASSGVTAIEAGDFIASNGLASLSTHAVTDVEAKEGSDNPVGTLGIYNEYSIKNNIDVTLHRVKVWQKNSQGFKVDFFPPETVLPGAHIPFSIRRIVYGEQDWTDIHYSSDAGEFKLFANKSWWLWDQKSYCTVPDNSPYRCTFHDNGDFVIDPI